MYDEVKNKDFTEEELKAYIEQGAIMRLDKYLKVSRLIKRRTLAKELSDQGRVAVNGHTAKAGTDVKIDDELVIQFGQKSLRLKSQD